MFRGKIVGISFKRNTPFGQNDETQPVKEGDNTPKEKSSKPGKNETF